MWLDYSIPGEVRISIEEYSRGLIDDFLEEITDTPEIPAASNLFNVRNDNKRELLNETRAHDFHHAVAQLLFTGIQFRKDAQMEIVFLTTRVRKTDEDNWKKLRRLPGYLKRTIKLPLILRADGVNVLKWRVDASYESHDNMRGHIGVNMSMLKYWCGSIISISKKQKLNTESSTEAELIGADNVMPQMLWTRYSLEAQGYGIDETVLYQDNVSAVLLEKNSKESSTKNIKHINVSYYLIECQVETRDVVIEHCPTEEMLGYHFTNSLQGALFRKFRAEIMNIPYDLDMGKM